MVALWLAGLLAVGAQEARAQDAGSAPPAVTAAEQNGLDHFLMGTARVLTHMEGPVGWVFFPAVATDPNAGLTLGVLPVALLSDPQHQIRHIVAPLIAYNQYFGASLLGSYYYYPSASARLSAFLEWAQKVNRRVGLRYVDDSFLDDRFLFSFDANLEEDGTPRFFGTGPASHSADQASYKTKEGLAQADFGVKLPDHVSLSAGWKFRRVETLPGAVDTPAMFDSRLLYASSYSMPRLTLARDTRDLVTTPGRGSYAELFTEFSRSALGSSASFQHYGGQWRCYLPTSPTMTTALHLQAHYSDGVTVPFTALASLGGARSLRGFQEGRFQDRGSLLASFEERFTLHTLSILNTLAQFQVAPFVDIGTVYPSPDRIRGKYFQPVLGGAFRAVVKPTVVGRVEAGVSREGPEVYMGIDYPF